MKTQKNIVLIAHDRLKEDMIEWASDHADELKKHHLFATGTTGKLLSGRLGLKIERFLSGPLGGDLQTGAHIVDGKIDVMIFFWDPLSPHPHDVDVKALLRIAVVHDIAVASNRASADFLMSSALMKQPYKQRPMNLTPSS